MPNDFGLSEVLKLIPSPHPRSPNTELQLLPKNKTHRLQKKKKSVQIHASKQITIDRMCLQEI